MARVRAGGTTSDFVYTTIAGGLLRTQSATLTIWSAESGGVQLTDLLLDGVPVTTIPVAADGQVPDFDLPDGVFNAWASADGGTTRVKLSLPSEDAQFASAVDDPGSATRAALSATYATKAVNADERLRYVNVFDAFMGGASNVWVDGQGITATTTTSEVASDGTVIPVANGTGLLNGVSLIIKEGTASQQVVRITAGGGTTSLTVTPALSSTLASGSAVTPFWEDSLHLTGAGYTGLAYFTMHAKDPEGNFLVTGTNPKITLLGNSWFARASAANAWSAQILAKIPGATVTNVALGGTTSATNLTRWNLVPTDSDYVFINEPGVNDDGDDVKIETQLANLAEMVRRIRGIGAVPLYFGHVPLSGATEWEEDNNRKTAAAIGDGYSFPAQAADGAALVARPNASSIGIGPKTQRRVTTGTDNTGFGQSAQGFLTTGSSNTGIGSLTQLALTTGAGNTAVGSICQPKITTANDNTAVGKSAQNALTTGSLNTSVGSQSLLQATTGHGNCAVGYTAMYAVTTGALNVGVGRDVQQAMTTGNQNTALGYSAGYLANGNTANATTTAVGQTLVGAQTGQGSATASNYITALGFKANADGHGAVAIGTDSGGVGAAASGANSFVLGTANHRYKMPGLPTVNPGVGSGILWNDAGTVKVA